jgi:hypothetical protein
MSPLYSESMNKPMTIRHEAGSEQLATSFAYVWGHNATWSAESMTFQKSMSLPSSGSMDKANVT